MTTTGEDKLLEVAQRIREMRAISGYSIAEMAERTEVSQEEYVMYESGKADFPFTFIHKCALTFHIGISDILEGHSAKLSTYTVTRKGQGQETAREDGIDIVNLAPMFTKKLAEPYYVCYEYDEELQNKPIHTTKHSGQEFDYVISGRMKVRVGENEEILDAGDSIFYNSSIDHGMIAVDGQDVRFLAIILPGENQKEELIRGTLLPGSEKKRRPLISDKYVDVEEDENGVLKKISFKNTETFNFAFDIVDEIARKSPNKLAMVHLTAEKAERRFTFRDIKRASSQTANYFRSLGIKKGDRVMLVLRRQYEFWYSILALHKLGAIAIPATDQLIAHDYEYRFQKANVKAIVCTGYGDATRQVDIAQKTCPSLEIKIVVGDETPEGWHSFNDEFPMYSAHFYRSADTPCGNDTMIMFFSSGTTGYPKLVSHSYLYALGHYQTARYWQGAVDGGLHLTISDTGWGKSLWGKLYGQWLCECAVFVYDFKRFSAADILPLFAKYNISTFCAPPTMLRMMIKEDISRFDLSSIVNMTTAGEALNPEVYRQFEKATGLRIKEGFGQTEGTLMIGNLIGEPHKIGSMGKPTPLYDIELLDREGNPAPLGQSGEICVRTSEHVPEGLFQCYCDDEEATRRAWHDGYYHTGDVAWMDEDGYLWYVGRADDVIKSSGYRIGPFEIESVIMELPYVLECGVSPAPDEVRGQVVKASIVLTKGTEGTEDLKKEIQEYVKKHTAPYKYPRIVVFRDSLPKTISGKIQRNQL